MKISTEARTAAERLLDTHRRAEDTDTDAEGNRVIVEFCQECDDDWPCDESYVAEALLDAAAAREAVERVRAEKDTEIDALLTLLARTASYLDCMEDRGYSSVRLIRSDVYGALRAAGREALPYAGEMEWAAPERKPRNVPGLQTRRPGIYHVTVPDDEIGENSRGTDVD
jgi:hypothetical protein